MEGGEGVSSDLVMPIRMVGHGVRGTGNELVLHRRKKFAVKVVLRRYENVAAEECGHALEVRSLPANRNGSDGRGMAVKNCRLIPSPAFPLAGAGYEGAFGLIQLKLRRNQLHVVDSGGVSN